MISVWWMQSKDIDVLLNTWHFYAPWLSQSHTALSSQYPEADSLVVQTSDFQPHSHSDPRLWGSVYASAFLRNRFKNLDLNFLNKNLLGWDTGICIYVKLSQVTVFQSIVSVYPIIAFRNHWCRKVIKIT